MIKQRLVKCEWQISLECDRPNQCNCGLHEVLATYETGEEAKLHAKDFYDNLSVASQKEEHRYCVILRTAYIETVLSEKIVE